MLKKLRNGFLIINMASIFVLVIIALFVIFFVTKSNIDKSISQNLDRAISMATSDREGGKSPNASGRPENAGTPQKEPPIPDETLNEDNSTGETAPSVLAYPETMRRFDDSRSFTVELDSSGNIVSVTSFFGVDNELYTLVFAEASKLTNLKAG
ncbi:hypothetical protein SDC9_178151 [bioreactor metagenome]|uniref:Uncharacterized protein n=1 Tax=bioreactor metagenome TaxID=1076179 RepID=A0A645GWE8_9ZZZZ